MVQKSPSNIVSLTESASLPFDCIIDVRSPLEYAHDHLPDAINLPVLSNEERITVGTLHKQDSAFAAKRHGAALVAANIARHLLDTLHDKPKDWSPLIYCWRGGNRSGAFVTICEKIGWKPKQLEGGYRSYRRGVVESLGTFPTQFRYIVICGVTGSGKSRLLRSLAQEGAQVLDLEDLAKHKGSVLGHDATLPQPSQKMFESLVLRALQGFDPTRPVFVEAESKKIGAVQVPDALMQTMRAAPCIRLEATEEQRVALLLEEYAHFLGDHPRLLKQLDCLVDLHGHAVVSRWRAQVATQDWQAHVRDLLVTHYDPAYLRGMARNYAHYHQAQELRLTGISEDAMRRSAQDAVLTASHLRL